METIGELVRKWREASGLKTADLAQRVRSGAKTEAGMKVQRQHIEQLEQAGARTPRYLVDLARAMGTTADDLLALRMPPPVGAAAGPAAGALPPPPPPPDFHDRRMVSDSDWQVLQDVRLVLSDEELVKIRERAERTRRVAREQLEGVGGKKSGT